VSENGLESRRRVEGRETVRVERREKRRKGKESGGEGKGREEKNSPLEQWTWLGM